MSLLSLFASPHRISSGSVVVVTPHDGMAVPAHAPLVQTSLSVQASPSSHALLFGSAALQLPSASLQDSPQLLSPSGPGHGLPAWMLHVPPLHVSAPLQNAASSHGVVLFA